MRVEKAPGGFGHGGVRCAPKLCDTRLFVGCNNGFSLQGLHFVLGVLVQGRDACFPVLLQRNVDVRSVCMIPAVWYNMVWLRYGTIWYGTVWRGMG